MPRHARSIASVRPTGPAPTTRTFVSFVRFAGENEGDIGSYQFTTDAGSAQSCSRSDYHARSPARRSKLGISVTWTLGPSGCLLILQDDLSDRRGGPVNVITDALQLWSFLSAIIHQRSDAAMAVFKVA